MVHRPSAVQNPVAKKAIFLKTMANEKGKECQILSYLYWINSFITLFTGIQNSDLTLIGSTQLLNCQWNSSDIDTCQMLKYQSSEPQTYIFS